MGYLEGDYRKRTWGNGQGELRRGGKPIDSTLLVRFPLWTVGAQSPRGPMSYYGACTPELFPWGSERVGYSSTDSDLSSVDSCSAGIKSWYSQTALGRLSKHSWNWKKHTEAGSCVGTLPACVVLLPINSAYFFGCLTPKANYVSSLTSLDRRPCPNLSTLITADGKTYLKWLSVELKSIAMLLNT